MPAEATAAPSMDATVNKAMLPGLLPPAAVANLLHSCFQELH